jgi:hypothetical protein
MKAVVQIMVGTAIVADSVTGTLTDSATAAGRRRV